MKVKTPILIVIFLLLAAVGPVWAQEPTGTDNSRRVNVGEALDLQPIQETSARRNASPVARSYMDRLLVRATIVDGDTIPYFILQPVKIVQTWSLLSKEEIRKNQKLIRNVKKTLPYAKEAKLRLQQLDQELAAMPPKKRSSYVKQVEKELLDDFEDELMDLTVSQGKILMKLVDRETGSSSYAIINEFRGSVRASFYQSFARMFGVNMKQRFDPAHNKDDELLERVARSVEQGRI